MESQESQERNPVMLEMEGLNYFVNDTIVFSKEFVYDYNSRIYALEFVHLDNKMSIKNLAKFQIDNINE